MSLSWNIDVRTIDHTCFLTHFVLYFIFLKACDYFVFISKHYTLADAFETTVVLLSTLC